MDDEIKSMMKAHRVAYTVSWQLDPAEFGTTDYIFADAATAQRYVTERLASGLPVTVNFFEDEHDFGNGNVASVSRATVAPWVVLREVADRLEAEDEEASCEP